MTSGLHRRGLLLVFAATVLWSLAGLLARATPVDFGEMLFGRAGFGGIRARTGGNGGKTMSSIKFAILVACVLSLSSQGAIAGVPLKGVDVKLGKNPGGSVARTSGGHSRSHSVGAAKVKSHSNTNNN